VTAAGGATPAAAGTEGLRALRWALLAGNLAIGCGVVVVAGALNDIVRSLGVSVALGGQLVTAAAIAMGLSAPLLAAVLSGLDRRRLLTFSLLWYAAGHAASALASDYTVLLALRVSTVLAAAVFTPQAAAAIGVLVPPSQRAGAITFVFLGWSLASVFGLPAAGWVAETVGWRWAFGAVALLAAAAALGTWRVLPVGVRPPALGWAAWRRVLGHPLLMGVVAVTALASASQFTIFSYFAPYYRQVLGADAAQLTFLLAWFGAFGLVGNLWVTRAVDRLGPARCVTLTLAAMALTFAAWPLAGSVALLAVVLVPWGLGCFSTNSAQQARLSAAAPGWAPALMALNTSAIYAGQALGAAQGGAWIASRGYGPLAPTALAWMLAALALSWWLARRMGTQRFDDA
jgi:predicted MFS family arabinose efflux permease